MAFCLSTPVTAYEESVSFDGDSSFSFINCSEIVWHIDPSTGHLSLPSLRSGPIRSGGSSCVAMTIEGPAMINFWWREDTNSFNVGKLLFMVDNKTILQCASSDWSPINYAVPSSTHQLKWDYRKIRSYPEYVGAGWIDDIRITYPDGWIPEVQSKSAKCCDQFPSIGADLKSVESRIDQVDLVIENLSSNQAELENRTSEIEDGLFPVNGSINDIYSQIEDLKSDRSKIDNLIDSMKLQELNDRFRGVNTKIEAINRTILNLSLVYTPSNNFSWISENIVYASNDSGNLEDIINKNRYKVILLDDGVYHTGGLNIITSDVHIVSLRKWGAILDADEKINGVILDTVRNVTLDSVTIINCTNGIHIENSTDCDIIRNRINDVDDIGIIVKNSNRTVLMLNKIDAMEKTEYTGIKLNRSNNNTLVFNSINVNKYDDLSSLYKIRLSRDNVIYTSNDGIIWDDSCGPSVSCSISDNEYICKQNNGHNDIVNLRNCSSNTWGFLN
jgi:parallel beta-helix repeat protein